jgi:hypothetical protein
MMFYGCSKFESFSSNLPRLEDANSMFYGCENLTTFTSDLPKLTEGYEMFCDCFNLTTFTSDLPKLTNGEHMFLGCSLNTDSIHNIALTINKDNTNRPPLFLGVSHSSTDEQAQRDYDLISYKGWDLIVFNRHDSESYTTFGTPKYAGCTTLDSIKAKDANYKTNDIVNGVWTEHLPDLNKSWGSENDSIFKNCTTLTTFNADLSSLTDAPNMFFGCYNLTSFNIDLPKLRNGTKMFAKCSNLTSFTSDLSSMTSGGSMFWNCYNLTSFNIDLPSLTSGGSMFSGCYNLTSFNVDLPRM